MKTINTKIMYVTIGRNGMERMTERYEHGDLYVKEHDYISASKKLAEYEDTGLTPEQIIQMERENIKLNKQNEEIQNSKIKYYYRAKDAEDRCKTTEKQNKRLKELLKLAFEEIERFYELNTGVRIVTWRYPEIKFDFTLDKNDRQIWKYADEVEEVLKDE